MVLGGDRPLCSSPPAPEIGFYQEAIAKARAQGKKTPRLVTVTHETREPRCRARLCRGERQARGDRGACRCRDAALRRPSTMPGAAGLPILITAGVAAGRACAGTFKGRATTARISGCRMFTIRTAIIRQYTKWDHRLTNIGQSRAGSEPRAAGGARRCPAGPVYLSLPRELTLHGSLDGAKLPLDGTTRIGPAGPIARSCRRHQRDRRAAGEGTQPGHRRRRRLGRNPATVAPLVVAVRAPRHRRGPSRVALPTSASRWTHPLMFQEGAPPSRMRISSSPMRQLIPWIPGGDRTIAATPGCRGDATTDPIKPRIPTFEFTADIRLAADPLLGDRGAAPRRCAGSFMENPTRCRFAQRAAALTETSKNRWIALRRDVESKVTRDAASTATRYGSAYQYRASRSTTTASCSMNRHACRARHPLPRICGSTGRARISSTPGAAGGWSSGQRLSARSWRRLIAM